MWAKRWMPPNKRQRETKNTWAASRRIRSTLCVYRNWRSALTTCHNPGRSSLSFIFCAARMTSCHSSCALRAYTRLSLPARMVRQQSCGGGQRRVSALARKFLFFYILFLAGQHYVPRYSPAKEKKSKRI